MSEDHETASHPLAATDQCPMCGARVLNPAVHKKWHEDHPSWPKPPRKERAK